MCDADFSLRCQHDDIKLDSNLLIFGKSGRENASIEACWAIYRNSKHFDE